MTREPYCSLLSQASGQPLYGTASQVKVWVLLEHPGSWPGQWLHHNDLPAPLQDWTHRLEAAIPHSRVAFIKRERPAVGRSLYLATTDPAAPRLYHLVWHHHREILDLDAAGILAGESALESVEEKLILVCTHGRRDRCCAKFGLPVYRAFEQEPDLSVWQCTHLGGHRFAANALVIPSGVCYGYLSPDDVAGVAQSVRRNEIHLPHYRGHSFYDPVVNAADWFVRRETGLGSDGVLQLESVERLEETHHVTFRAGRDRHRVELISAVGEPQLVSCGKPPKEETHHTFVGHRLLGTLEP